MKPPPQEHGSRGSWAPAGREKAIQDWGWQLKAAKRYLDHRGMKLAAARRLEPRIACRCKLAAFGLPRAELCVWEAAGEAPPPRHQPRSEQMAGVPTRGAASILPTGSRAPCLGHQPRKAKGFMVRGLGELGGLAGHGGKGIACSWGQTGDRNGSPDPPWCDGVARGPRAKQSWGQNQPGKTTLGTEGRPCQTFVCCSNISL